MLMIAGPVDSVLRAARVRRAGDSADPVRRDGDRSQTIHAAGKNAPWDGRERRAAPPPSKADAGARPAGPNEALSTVRAYAPLIAQLIATKLGLAQTRARRRSTADEAAAAYDRARRQPRRNPFDLKA